MDGQLQVPKGMPTETPKLMRAAFSRSARSARETRRARSSSPQVAVARTAPAWSRSCGSNESPRPNARRSSSAHAHAQDQSRSCHAASLPVWNARWLAIKAAPTISSRSSVRSDHSLQANQAMLEEMPELQGSRRAKLVGLLLLAAVVMGGTVELFVRFVLDPAFASEEAAVLVAAMDGIRPTGPQPKWSFTGSGLSDGLSDLGFADLICVLTWMVCVVTGLGSEFFVGYEYLTSGGPITRWHEHAWFVAQFLFSVMILVSIQLARTGNPLSLVFAVLGMWKFGFPETLLCILSGYHGEGSRCTRRLTGFLNGCGTLAHHSSSLLFISIFTLQLSPLTRPLLAGSMPLVLQHIVISLKYYSVPLYAAAELALEIYWEWEVLSVLELFYLPHGVPLSDTVHNPMYSSLIVRCICGMLLAHWLYWAAALLDGFDQLACACFGRREDGAAAMESGDSLSPTNPSRARTSPSMSAGRPRNWQGSEVAEWRAQFEKFDRGQLAALPKAASKSSPTPAESLMVDV